MNKKLKNIALSLSIGLFIAPVFVQAVSTWVVPDDSLRYDQVSWPTSHNSFTGEDGWEYKQQHWSVKKQLKKGIRGLMQDIHYSDADAKKTPIRLCHGSCTGLEAWVGRSDGKFQTLKSSFTDIKKFLVDHPKAIITIFFESYVSEDDLNKVISGMGTSFTEMILRKKNWNLDRHDGKWPTLKWMREKNKRLVLLSNRTKQETYIYYQWNLTKENMYGTLNVNEACKKQRGESKGGKASRRLSVLNLIESVLSPLTDHNDVNSPANLKKLVSACKKTNIVGEVPNFISLDFVDKGDVIGVANTFNKATLEKVQSQAAQASAQSESDAQKAQTGQ